MSGLKNAKPFIKWAGGKTQLLENIIRCLPKDFCDRKVTYIEPFVGGGALMFYLLQCFPNIQHAVINDINEKLIDVYRIIKEQPEELIAILRLLEKEYIPLSNEERASYFMDKREQFNKEKLHSTEKSALFIFLNKTCFNGLYRENTKGYFNVPHGRYLSPKICDEDTIMADAEVLQRVTILCGDFSDTRKYAGEDTLYYFDPPYKPLSTTSSFNTYVKEPFNDAEQIRLCDFCHQVARKGSMFILSNSDMKNEDPTDNFFDDLYVNYDIQRVFANRMVNAKKDRRGKLSELIISNIPQK